MEHPDAPATLNTISNTTRYRLSPQKLLQVMTSEKITMYIGLEEKLYLVPRELICYYSTVLNTHFNKETCIRKEIPLRKAKYVNNNAKHLRDCLSAQFDMLLECMLQGGISKRWINGYEAIEDCIALLECSAKLDMGDVVSEAVFETVRSAIKKSVPTPAAPTETTIPRRDVSHRGFTAEHIKAVFDATKTGNPLRALVAQDVLSRQGLKGTGFEDMEVSVPEFAAELLNQFRESVSFWAWTDPISGLQRTFDRHE
ncbi:uncharacterized protein RSE6_12554 [Rhynchosporium secalis]|uniref:BTB domain-containing protein n=1 Tax=Rhynchosporium secalis TaxID=38038 RepID=A0A1E1MQR0_RHYSE|nr:uncharacterized protein RSE6_12554 [Rhynchosporium secalis]